MRGCIATVKKRADENNIAIQFSHPGVAVVEINGDRTMLEHVVVNLLENSIKYSEPKDDAYQPIQVRVDAAHTNVNLTITNRTEPIPPEKLAKLFDRFYQVNTSRSKKTGGYGLGLAIVKKFVEDHGGTILAMIENDTITFSVELPATTKLPT